MLRRLKEIVSDEMIDEARIEDLGQRLYPGQADDAGETEFKRLINYGVVPEWRPKLLARLLDDVFPDGGAGDGYYLDGGELKVLAEAGMIIGSHSVNHPLMSELTPADQRREIVDSFAELDALLGPGPAKTFSYPFGGWHSFTDDTIGILEQCECLFSFNVESRDITADDCLVGRQCLPRYDCSEFPFGRASQGRNRAAQAGDCGAKTP